MTETQTQPQPSTPTPQQQNEPQRVELSSTLEAVTVFKDRAQLSYYTEVQLTPGPHILSLKGGRGWEGLEASTLQVRVGEASQQPIIMRGVRTATHITREDVRERVGALEKEIDNIQEKLNTVSDKKSVNDAMEEAVKQLEQKLIHMGERGLGPNKQVDVGPIAEFLSQPKEWMNLIRFITGRKKEIDESRLELSEEERTLNYKKAQLQRKLDDLRYGIDHVRRETSVEVTISVQERPVELKLYISFVVMGASWTPLYDIRVDSKQATMDITYHAQVQQSTSVDWTKVEMRLSTATPHFSPHPPKLEEWNISLKPPTPPMRPMMLMRCGARPGPPPPPPPNAMADPVSENDDEIEGAAFAAPVPQAASVEQAIVSSSSTASTFQIVGFASVKSDNKPVRVTISQHTFPVKLLYQAIPKCNSFTYLFVKTKNTSPYVFLPGKTNVFADNIFVSNSQLELVPAGAEFTTSLGTDDTISVTRKLVKKMKSTVRTMLRNPHEVTEYVYEFTVKGSIPTEADLIVKDQSPISSDNDIKVEMNEPSKKMLNDGKTVNGINCNIDNVGVLEWKLKLPPGVLTQVFRFAFQVEYPEGLKVIGLDN